MHFLVQALREPPDGGNLVLPFNAPLLIANKALNIGFKCQNDANFLTLQQAPQVPAAGAKTGGGALGHAAAATGGGGRNARQVALSLGCAHQMA